MGTSQEKDKQSHSDQQPVYSQKSGESPFDSMSALAHGVCEINAPNILVSCKMELWDDLASRRWM
jgi:hypothetical protein